MKVLLACFSALLLALGCGEEPPSQPGPSSRAEPPPAPVKVTPFAFGQPDLVLLVTGGTGGLLEVCNCAGPMAGGLSRRSGMAISYRKAFPQTLMVDSGDFCWVDSADLRNDYLLKGYGQIGYDAVVLGDQEWSTPAARLRELLTSQPLPYLSTGIDADDGDKLPLQRQVTRQWAAVKVAVVSAMGREDASSVGEERMRSLKFSPEEFQARARQLKKAGYVVIAVAHCDEDGTGKVATCGLADLVVRGHCRKSAERLQNAQGEDYKPGDAGVPVVRAGGSDMVGVVAMKVRDGRIVAMEYRLEAADERWPEDKRLLQTYSAYSHAAMRQALDAERKAGLEYVPSNECGRCHVAQYDKWKSTRHAHAYKTLTDGGRAGDPNCLMCHTSGFGTTKGFFTIEKTEDLANVNCQDCHRFSVKEHRAAGWTPPPRPGDEVCTSCHTALTDPRFDISVKLPKVACPKSR